MSDIQRSAEWYQARLGKPSASRMSDLLATTKTGYAASRNNYLQELLIERISGMPTESYQSAAMQWGIETEPLARSAYEVYTGVVQVTECGFVLHESGLFGASPDGLVIDEGGEQGCLEIKCPNTATHMDFIIDGSIPLKYQWQMICQMECTNRKTWCDFVSFDPRVINELQFKVKRFYYDADRAAKMVNEVNLFSVELDTKEKLVRELLKTDINENWRN